MRARASLVSGVLSASAACVHRSFDAAARKGMREDSEKSRALPSLVTEIDSRLGGQVEELAGAVMAR